MMISPRRALLTGAFSLICSAAMATSHTYSYVLIAVPNASQTNPIAINKSGTVLGTWLDSAHAPHGFTYRNGKIATFDAPNSTGTQPTGINDNGEIVGAYQDLSHNTHGFLYSAKGEFKFIDLTGSEFTSLTGINAGGTAVGEGLDRSGNLETFTYQQGVLYAKGVFTTIVDNMNYPIAVAINVHGSVTGFYQPPMPTRPRSYSSPESCRPFRSPTSSSHNPSASITATLSSVRWPTTSVSNTASATRPER